jgi:DNA-binding beta-propeller fold protein YncE
MDGALLTGGDILPPDMLHLLFSALVSLTGAQSEPLKAQPPIVIPGGAGKFDFMNVDAKDRLAFACHPGKSAFVVIDLSTEKVQNVEIGTEVNGIDADPIGHKVYAAGPGKVLVSVDMKSWKKVGELPLSGPGDSVIFDQTRGVLYVDNDDGTSLWFVSPKSLKISKTVTIKEAPEVMVLDSGRKRIYQNIKTSNSIQVIDLTSGSVVSEYALGTLTGPHGLAEDTNDGKLFSVGKNGKLVVVDADSGKILTTIDVTKGSDQIAYDASLKRIYIPGTEGLQTVQVTATGATVIGSAPCPRGCHSVTVDPKTHSVWVVYADSSNSYAMKYAATK